jgi:hypothetical protein
MASAPHLTTNSIVFDTPWLPLLAALAHLTPAKLQALQTLLTPLGAHAEWAAHRTHVSPVKAQTANTMH